MLYEEKIIALRMERQFLLREANEEEYNALYRDTQPGQNVYWNGFGEPPSMTFRASFDDVEYNRQRQAGHALLKGRFQGGNLGWLDGRDIELFACMCQKPLGKPTFMEFEMLQLIERQGPLTIQQIKEESGLLVKQITPILHRLQEAFLIYEDQYDGAWDRGWYRFGEMFPEVSLSAYTRLDALKTVLSRFAYRHVCFDIPMARSFYRLPQKDINEAADSLVTDNVFLADGSCYSLVSDRVNIENAPDIQKNIFAVQRNDFLVRSNDHWLKKKYKHPEYDILYFLLIDGAFRGAVYGHFKFGPCIIEDVVVDDGFVKRKDEIFAAVAAVTDPANSPVQRYMGKTI